MRLLIYSHAFAPQVGGIETFAGHLARGFAGSSFERGGAAPSVTVVTQTSGAAEFPSAGLAFHVARRPGPLALWRLIRDAERVLLAGPAILPLAFALLQGKVVVVTHHGYQSICPNGMLFQFPMKSCCPGHFAARRYGECLKCNAPQVGVVGSVRILVLTFARRLLSRFATSNVAVSEHVAMRIALPGTVVIRNGVPETASPRRLPAKATLELPTSFAFVGRLVTEKGVPILLEAARILKSRSWCFRILIVGDGPERESLQRLTHSLNLDNEVAFLGFHKGTALKEVMTNVSALVMPSVCEDAAPVSVLEQMMEGKVVIGSHIGGLAEEVGDAGLLFEPGNATALANRMERVILQPGLKESLGERARERARKLYTLKRFLREYENLLRSRGHL